VLLPGLINSHCHLDYTGMAGHLPPPKSFPDWIKGMLALKAHWSYSEYAASWIEGARMLLRNGVTTVADMEAVPELLPDVWSATPMRVCSFLEMTGVKSRRDPRDVLHEALDRIDSLPCDRHWLALAPHAPYSTSPELLALTAVAASERELPVSVHVAESDEEFQMYTRRDGPLFAWLKGQRHMGDCGHGSPVQQLERCGLLSSRLLAAHVNYLGQSDAELLGRRGVHVVHCPRSHAYFGHRAFPATRLAAAGVNLCLGTDSLASVVKRRQPVELDLFAEMRTFAQMAPDLDPRRILEMATVNGARALGIETGVIETGKWADLIAIPYEGGGAGAAEAVVHHKRAADAVMIHGQWEVPPNS
jgi:cytosine/adenosine deaminase-related metal-dependent hydrolase